MKYIISKKIVVVDDTFGNILLYDLRSKGFVYEIDLEIFNELKKFQIPCEFDGNDLQSELLSNNWILPFNGKDNYVNIFDTKKIISYSKIKQRKSVSKAVVYLTNACNLNCIHCGLDSGEPLLSEMDDNLIKNLVNQIHSEGFEVLQFSGGEPFLRKKLLFQLLLDNYKKFEIIGINTNTVLLNKNDIQVLKKIKNLVVYVSIYGFNSESYIKNTNRDNFLRAEENIKLLVDNGIDVRASICLHKNTIAYLNDYKSYIESLGISKIAYIGIIPVGRASTGYMGLIGPWKDYIKTLNHIPTILDESFDNDEIIDHPWHLVKMRIVVMANGEVLPSEFFPVTFGNIQNSKLSDLLSDKLVKYYLYDFNVDNVNFCRDCAFRYICKSICPSFAYRATGSIKNPPLTCQLALKNYYKKSNLNFSFIKND